MNLQTITAFLGKALVSAIISLTTLLSSSGTSTFPISINSHPTTPTTTPSQLTKLSPIPFTKKQVATISPSVVKTSSKNTKTVSQSNTTTAKTPSSAQTSPNNASTSSPNQIFVLQPTTDQITTSTNPNFLPPISSTTTSYALSADMPQDSAGILNRIQNSIVNIYCTTQSGTQNAVLTGSGVVIDPRGIVLTNAHVAQYVLLQKSFSSVNLKCVGRMGSPAAGIYPLDVLYISPTWVETNYKNIAESNPKETGQYDFALLKFNSTQGNQSFSYLPLAPLNQETQIGQRVILVSYPALIYQTQGLNALLRSSIDKSTIQDDYSFTNKEVDLIETGTTPVAEPGASGGAITNEQGYLIGIIATVLSSGTNITSGNSNYIHGITISHINDALETYKFLSLQDFLTYDVTTLKNNFDATLRDRLTSLLLSGMQQVQ